MSTANAYLSVSGIDVDVVYKEIKNLHIGVYPPFGRVRVSAPRALGDEQIRLAVVRRLPWIERQREQLRAAERQSFRTLEAGESHYVWGQRYRLEIIERPGVPRVEINGRWLTLCVVDGSDHEQKLRILDRWYRRQLRDAIPPLIAKWEPKIGVSISKWSVRRMKTKWGSCNRETASLWFNVELAKKHPAGLEYLVVHEMAHLVERGHGDRFVQLMDGFLPDWRQRRDQLNGEPLGHAVWGTSATTTV